MATHLIPVTPCVPLQRSEDDGQNGGSVFGHQADDVVVVPQEQRTLRHLQGEGGGVGKGKTWMFVERRRC